MGWFDFGDVLVGLRWPGRKLESRESIKHEPVEWGHNRATGLAYGRCRNCHQIVRLRDYATMRPALVSVEFDSRQWLALRGSGGGRR